MIRIARWMVSCAFASSVPFAWAVEDSSSIYDADFDHDTSGQEAPSDTGEFPRHHPSGVHPWAEPLGTTPTVRHGKLVMERQSLVHFKMPAGFIERSVRLDLDVEPLLDPMDASFWRVMFETPSVQNIELKPAGTIEILNSVHYGEGQYYGAVGAYPLGGAIHLTVIAHPGRKVVHDYGARKGSLLVYVNNEPVWTGSYYTHPDHPATQGITFALGGASERQCALIDNVRISFIETPPEESSVAAPKQIAGPAIRTTQPVVDRREREKLAEARLRACSE